MLVIEAYHLATLLDQLTPLSVLDIGSGSRAEREIIQPHIGAAFRGHHVTWTDLNESSNTMYCDITDAERLSDLPRCEMVTACSVLEHVTDIDTALLNLQSLVERWLLVSVPHRYPEHHFPIDNLWRPSPSELAAKVEGTGLHVIESWLAGPEQFGNVPDASASMVLATRFHCSGR
jgi:hypothetical protein